MANTCVARVTYSTGLKRIATFTYIKDRDFAITFFDSRN